MDSEFDGLVAVVTGGASGIGAATADRLAAAGARVAVLDRDLSSSHQPHYALPVDISDRDLVARSVKRVADHFGRIDIVVNNAGIGAQGDITANDDDEWARVLSVNVTGIARVTGSALPWLRKSPSAAVVNLSSITATAGVPNRALYSASKGAILSLTRAMAADHLSDGIRVNAVCPGAVETPWATRILATTDDPEAARAAYAARQPHGRFVSAAEVADAVLYLAHPRSGSTTGTAIAVDGGMQELRLSM